MNPIRFESPRPSRRLARAAVVPWVALFAGCSDATVPPVTPAVPPKAALKIELDYAADDVRWADNFSSPELFVFVSSSAAPGRRQVISAGGTQSVFYLPNLPAAKPGDEYVVEVWDDDTLTDAERDAIARGLEAGMTVLLLASGPKGRFVAAAAGPAIGDGADSVVAQWEGDSWDYLGKATLKVGDNGLPRLEYATPVPICAPGRGAVGQVSLYVRTPSRP